MKSQKINTSFSLKLYTFEVLSAELYCDSLLTAGHLQLGHLQLGHLHFNTFTHLPFFLTVTTFLHLVQFLQALQPLLLQVLQFLQALHVVLVQVLPSQVLGEVAAFGQAAAAVIAITKKTSIKILTALTIVFCIIFPPFSST